MTRHVIDEHNVSPEGELVGMDDKQKKVLRKYLRFMIGVESDASLEG